MRRSLIQTLLPIVFASLPVLAALLILATLPPNARAFYLTHVSPFDGVILGVGGSLFLVQTYLAFRALRWIGEGFDERPDSWINHLAQSSEWFPLLGLIGTVCGILQTFSIIGPDTPTHRIIKEYAPALTATGSGLFMALINILPSWVIIVGRKMIGTLGGEEPPT